MKKNAKAAIAVAAGVLLLLGGGGTLAVWNSNLTANGGSIETGTLKFGGTPTAMWVPQAAYDAYAANPSASGALTTLQATALGSSYKLVPEDHVVLFVPSITLDASGGSLFYYLAPDLSSVSVTSGATTTTGTAAASTAGLTIGAPDVIGTPLGTTVASGTFYNGGSSSGSTFNIGDPSAPVVYNVTSSTSATSATFTVAIPVTFDANGTDNQGVSFNLSNAVLKVQQVIKQ